ncbi:MAG: hypothetical protein NZM35_00390 [Chitinophagales bacterium]|nr:hypothetical protein [Chitinophagales bacterium]MDW8417775.1 hypothetical protein [Chitinophagales bacterium]
MSMLSDFLRTLKPDELAIVRQMPASEREKQVLLNTLVHLQDKEFDDELVQYELKLSKSHFDKINSVLLDKCYHVLTDGSNREVLYLLWQKGLKTLLLHEAKIRERKLLKGNKKKLAELYKIMFDISVRLPVLNGKIALAEEYGRKYLATLGKPAEEQRSEIWLNYLFGTVFYYAANGKMAEYEAWTKAELKKWARKLEGKDYPVCQFYYHLCWSAYYEHYSSDWDNLMKSLHAALEALGRCEERVGSNYRIYVETTIAKAYAHNSNYREAYERYSACFDKFAKQLVRNRYHPLMYAVIAILHQQYDVAESIMEKYMKFYLENTPHDTFNFDIERIYALLYMYKKDYTKAAYYLQRGQQWDKTKFTFLGDILQRITQNIYFILQRDFEMALTLLRSNKRFLQSKQPDEMTREYGVMFDLINDVIRLQTGKEPSKNFLQNLEQSRRGIMRLYAGLLDEFIPQRS